MAVEHIRRWTIGEVELVRLVEINAFEDDVEVLLTDGTPELIKRHAWLQPNFATPDGRIKLSFQAFVVQAGDRRIMVDTCIGNDRARSFEAFANLQSSFLEDLSAAGFPPETIDTVLCTHLHFDHCGWNTRRVDGRWVPTFPNARYLLGRVEWDHWRTDWEQGRIEHPAHLVDSIQPILDAGLAQFVETDHRVCDEVRLVPTPGHTPGHVSVQISSAGADAIITGDLIHHPVQFVVPDMATNFCMDVDQARRTRQAFLERVADRKALVIGSHFCDPTAGWVERDAGGWRFFTD